MLQSDQIVSFVNPKTRVRIAIYDGVKDILLFSTRFWNFYVNHGVLANSISDKRLYIDFSCEKLTLYLYKETVLKLIKEYINKYNVKCVLFMGICKDTLYFAEIIKMLCEMDEKYKSVTFHIAGFPFCCDLTNINATKWISPMMYNHMTLPVRKNYWDKFKCLNICTYLEGFENVILHPVICNLEINNVDGSILDSNIKPDGKSKYVKMAKPILIKNPEFTTFEDSHGFFGFMCKNHPKESNKIIKQIINNITNGIEFV